MPQNPKTPKPQNPAFAKKNILARNKSELD